MNIDVMELEDWSGEMQRLRDAFCHSAQPARCEVLCETLYYFENPAIGHEYKDPLLWHMLLALGPPHGEYIHSLIFQIGKYHSAYSEYVLHAFAPLITNASIAWQYLVSSENYFGENIPPHFAAAFDCIASFAAPESSTKLRAGTQEEIGHWHAAENIRDALREQHLRWD